MLNEKTYEQAEEVIKKAFFSKDGLSHEGKTVLESVIGRARRLEKEVEKLFDDKQTWIEASKQQHKALKVIKTDTSSQACPTCKSNVNGKYCSWCGQKLSYSIY